MKAGEPFPMAGGCLTIFGCENGGSEVFPTVGAWAATVTNDPPILSEVPIGKGRAHT